jgi:hypothetical protein
LKTRSGSYFGTQTVEKSFLQQMTVYRDYLLRKVEFILSSGFFYVSHLGTAVASVHEQTHINTTHTPHSHPMYTNRPYNST